jgi:hypothetical protein
VPKAVRLKIPAKPDDLAQSLARSTAARPLRPNFIEGRGKSMGTFFDRRQLMVSVVLLGILELTVVVARALAH